MTSTKTLSDNKGYSSRNFFRFTLKRNGQHFALYLILTLFVMVLPCWLMIDDFMDDAAWYERELFWLLNHTESIVNTSYVIAILLSAGIAVLAGMSALAYVNEKTAVGCYHSFPIRRESMFFTETLTRAGYYLASYLIGCGVSWIIMRLTLEYFPEFQTLYLKCLAAGLLIFCLTYAIVLLAGGLCGTNVMKFLMFGVILFLPVILYAMLVCMAEIAVENFDTSYYISNAVFRWLSPVWDAAVRIDELIQSGSFRLWHMIPEALAIYGGALLLHKYRRSEDSGTTIIWKPVLRVVKYLLIFTASLLGAYVFYEGIFTGSGGHPIKMFLGALMAAVLAFMVANSLLYRSTRAMFRDGKPFLVCLAVIVVFLILVPLNATGLIGKTYSESNTKSIELTIDGETMTYTDPDTVAWLIPMTDPVHADDPLYQEQAPLPNLEYITGDGLPDIVRDRYEDISEKYRYELMEAEKLASYHSNTMIYRIVQKPKFGLPLAKTYSIDANTELWDRISRTDEYAAEKNAFREIDPDSITYASISLLADSVNFQWGTGTPLTDEQNAQFTRLMQAYRYDPEKRRNAVSVGSLHFNYRTDEGKYSASVLPIYSDDLEFLNCAAQILGVPAYSSEDEVLDAAADCISNAVLANAVTGEARRLDRETCRELLDKCVFIDLGDNWLEASASRVSQVPYLMVVTAPEYETKWIEEPAPGDVAVETRPTYDSESWETVSEIRFRADAVTEDELKTIFDSLK